MPTPPAPRGRRLRDALTRIRSGSGSGAAPDDSTTSSVTVEAARASAAAACVPSTERRVTPTRILVWVQSPHGAWALALSRYLALDHEVALSVVLDTAAADDQTLASSFRHLGARVDFCTQVDEAVAHELAVVTVGTVASRDATNVVFAVGSSPWPALDVAARVGVPAVWSVSVSPAAVFGARPDPRWRSLAEEASTVLVPDQALATAWSAVVDADRIHVVAPGVDVGAADEQRFGLDRDRVRESFGCGPGEVLLVVASNDRSHQRAAIAAVTPLVEHSTPWRLALFDAAADAAISDAILSAGLADRVLPLPAVPDPERWFVAADATLWLGAAEVGTDAMVQPMVFATPTVTTESHAHLGPVTTARPGGVVVLDAPGGDADPAAVLGRLLDSPGELADLGAAAEDAVRTDRPLVAAQQVAHRLLRSLTGPAPSNVLPAVRDGRGSPTTSVPVPTGPADATDLLHRWRSAPHRVLITDNWPTNAGDMAIARTTETVIRAYWPGAAVVHAVYHHDLDVADLHEIDVVPSLETLIGARGRDPDPNWATIGDELVRGADLLVSQGGGFFTGHAESYPRLQALHEATAMAQRFAVGGQTVGRYDSARIRRLLRETYERATLIGARDAATVEILAELGVPSRAVLRAGDMVLARFPTPPPERPRSEGPVVVFLTDTALVGPDVDQAAADAVVDDVLAQVLAATQHPVLVTSSVLDHGVGASQDDGRLIDAVLDRLPSDRRARVRRGEGPLSVADLEAVTRDAYAVISMRFHPALFACAQGTPFALIQPGSKSTVLGDQDGRVTRDAFDPVSRAQAIARALAPDAPSGVALWESLAEPRARTDRLVAALHEVLSSCS